jgi:hypothetical protein
MSGQRGVSTLGAVLLAGTAGLLTATLLMDWMVVDVHVVDETPVHIKVPFPLVIADMATGLIPEEALREAKVPPEARAQKELVLAAVRTLAECPDAQLVKVRTEDASVDIIKDGDTLRIAVDADDAVVRCNIPIDGVAEALERWDWETADPKMLFDVLRAADNGELITVATEDGVRVAITMW